MLLPSRTVYERCMAIPPQGTTGEDESATRGAQAMSQLDVPPQGAGAGAAAGEQAPPLASSSSLPNIQQRTSNNTRKALSSGIRRGANGLPIGALGAGRSTAALRQSQAAAAAAASSRRLSISDDSEDSGVEDAADLAPGFSGRLPQGAGQAQPPPLGKESSKASVFSRHDMAVIQDARRRFGVYSADDLNGKVRADAAHNAARHVDRSKRPRCSAAPRPCALRAAQLASPGRRGAGGGGAATAGGGAAGGGGAAAPLNRMSGSGKLTARSLNAGFLSMMVREVVHTPSALLPSCPRQLAAAGRHRPAQAACAHLALERAAHTAPQRQPRAAHLWGRHRTARVARRHVLQHANAGRPVVAVMVVVVVLLLLLLLLVTWRGGGANVACAHSTASRAWTCRSRGQRTCGTWTTLGGASRPAADVSAGPRGRVCV